MLNQLSLGKRTAHPQGKVAQRMLRATRSISAFIACGCLLVWLASALSAQQVFRWTDEQGNLHFGDQPPPNAKGLEARSSAKSEGQIECEAAVRQQCFAEDHRLEKWNPDSRQWRSELLRRCLDTGVEECKEKLQTAKPKATEGAQRYIATATLQVDPSAGESLKCEMTCKSNCRGALEIRTDRVLKRGENYGGVKYSIEVKPERSGAAFCSVNTTSNDVVLVMAVVQDGKVKRTTEAQ
jgi:hypothetical protein